MTFVDYTHPEKVPPLYLPHDRRSAEYYVRLPDLPASHPYYAEDWILFRYPVWLEAGAAWVHAVSIAEDVGQLAQSLDVPVGQLRPIIGSDDPGYDEALAQSLITMGFTPRIAELSAR